MFLVVGLGNPGEEYKKTRHNVGFMVLDYLVKGTNFPPFKHKKKTESDISEIEMSGRKVILSKPQTYMNNSGISVSNIINWYKIKKENIIAIYDDLDLELGKVRIRRGGSSGGHKGIESIIQSIGTADFKRIKIGIGRDKFREAKDYVLENFSAEELRKIEESFLVAKEAITEILSLGIDSAMNKFNGDE